MDTKDDVVCAALVFPQVCLTNGGLLIPSFPIWKVGAEQEPSRTVLDNLRHHMKLFGNVYQSCLNWSHTDVLLSYINV